MSNADKTTAVLREYRRSAQATVSDMLAHENKKDKELMARYQERVAALDYALCAVGLADDERTKQGTNAMDKLTESAPARLWLQVDVDGDAGDRDEPIPRENWGALSWHYESIGGTEVEYVRTDIIRAAMPINCNDPDDPAMLRLAELLGMTANA